MWKYKKSNILKLLIQKYPISGDLSIWKTSTILKISSTKLNILKLRSLQIFSVPQPYDQQLNVSKSLNFIIHVPELWISRTEYRIHRFENNQYRTTSELASPVELLIGKQDKDNSQLPAKCAELCHFKRIGRKRWHSKKNGQIDLTQKRRIGFSQGLETAEIGSFFLYFPQGLETIFKNRKHYGTLLGKAYKGKNSYMKTFKSQIIEKAKRTPFVPFRNF